MRVRNYFVLVFSLFLPFSLEARNCHHTSSNLFCLEYVDNYDGDTITFNIPNLHPLIGDRIKVRLSGVDTPEIKSQNTCEKELAYYTRDLVKKILRGANSINLKNAKREKYFRIVGDVLVDGKSLGELLLEKKLAISYDGGHKPKVDWCRVSKLYLE